MVSNADSILHRVLDSFEEFVVKALTEKIRQILGHDPVCLADFIEAWARSGDGIHACQGDEKTFAAVNIVIVELWSCDPKVVDYVSDQDPVTGMREIVSRPVEDVLGPAGYGHPILDPHFFEQCVKEQRHSR